MGTIEANPDPQRETLWCWAASMSMIFSSLGHKIQQESIVKQVYGAEVNWPSGPLTLVNHSLNRNYVDMSGKSFSVTATSIQKPEDAVEALTSGHPIIYSGNHHFMVQTEVIYQVVPGGPMVVKGGKLWDPEPNIGWRSLSAKDVAGYVAAWAIQISGSGHDSANSDDDAVGEMPHQTGSTKGLCDGLNKAVSLSHSDFHAIRGALRSQGHWSTSFTLGQFSKCSIFDYTDAGDFTLVCGEPGGLYSDVKTAVASCLLGWKPEINTDKQGDEYVQFNLPPATAMVQLGMHNGTLELKVEK